MTAQIAADLRAAADVLERDGWTQGAYITDQGSCCAVGALLKVVDPEADATSGVEDLEDEDYGRVTSATKFLTATIGLRPGHFWDATVTRWNDDRHSAAEVIAALRAAADRAEADQ